MIIIQMNDDTEYQVIGCGLSDGVVSFQLKEAMTAEESVNVFNNIEATKLIKYILKDEQSNSRETLASYEGYTDLIGILIDRNSRRPLIQLQKEERNAT